MQNAETVLSVLRDRWRAVMRGNSHVRFGPEAVGKGSAPQTPRQRPTGTKHCATPVGGAQDAPSAYEGRGPG